MESNHVNVGSYRWREMKSFVLHTFTGRFFMVFASLIIMSVGGSVYMFDLYSDAMKASMGYDQSTLNLLSFAKDLGTYFSFIAGLINQVIPTRAVLLIGTLMNFFGYFMFWLAVTGHTSKPHLSGMFMYIFIGGNSVPFLDSATTVACVKNFPESRAIIIGLLKAYLGLSGAILTQLHHAIYGDNGKSVILLCAWLPSAVFLIVLPAFRVFNNVQQQKNEVTTFYHIFYASLAPASLLMVLIIVQSKVSFNRIEFVVSAGVVILSLFGPLGIVVREDLKIWRTRREPLDDFSPTNTVTTNSVQDVELVPITATLDQKHVGWVENIFNPPARGEDYSILQAVFSIDMQIIFIATICGFGGMLAAIDNLGQIGNSLNYSNSNISTFVSLVSIWSYLGRVATSFPFEYLFKHYKIPRPLFYAFVILLPCIGHLLIAFAVPKSINLASIIIGFCFGAQWPLIDVIISEIFGLKYYSTLRSFGLLASPIGSYIMKVRIAGHLYDKEALKQMKALGLTWKPDEDLTCNGKQCYKMAFIIIFASTLFGFFVSLILVFRTWKFYRSDIHKKFREESMVVDINLDPTSESEGTPDAISTTFSTK